MSFVSTQFALRSTFDDIYEDTEHAVYSKAQINNPILIPRRRRLRRTRRNDHVCTVAVFCGKSEHAWLIENIIMMCGWVLSCVCVDGVHIDVYNVQVNCRNLIACRFVCMHTYNGHK